MVKEKEKTFTLVLSERYLGRILKAFEENGSIVIGLKYMSVNSEFTIKHLNRSGRFPLEPYLYDSYHQPEAWESCLTSWPVVAVLLEGVDVITRTRALMARKWKIHFPRELIDFNWSMVYSSFSIKSAREDIELWFSDEPDKLSEECKKDLVCLLPNGQTCGREQDLPNHYLRRKDMPYHQICFSENLVFVLIKPAAFQSHRVGEIMAVLIYYSLSLRGLKLVKLDGCPENIAWSADSSSSEDGYSPFCVAIVLEHFQHDGKVRVTNKGDNYCHVNLDT